jgi:hypothetical protein
MPNHKAKPYEKEDCRSSTIRVPFGRFVRLFTHAKAGVIACFADVAFAENRESQFA